jgi:predicted dehydrogenase
METNMPDPKRVLVIGVGSIGHRHLRCFQSTGRVRLSICEVNRDLARQIAQQYGVDRVYHDVEAALADRPDAAVVTTPAHLHVPIATRLADAGVHVLIEKPLSTSLAGIDELERTIERRGVVAAVAYVYHAHPVLADMRKAILDGRFGQPVHLVAACGQHFPTYRPAYREIYYKDRATGGGAIQDALTHILNAAEWVVGPIDRLVCDASHQVLDGVEVEDTVNLLARHGRVQACYSLNQHQAPSEVTITVVCEQGTARFEGHAMRWRWTQKPDEPWHDVQFDPIERDALFVAQAQGFLDALDGLAPPLCTLGQGVQTLRVNLAALESADRHAWQTISCPEA